MAHRHRLPPIVRLLSTPIVAAPVRILARSLRLVALILLALLPLQSAIGQTHYIPDHTHWTVNQCIKYWKTGGRNFDVHVALSAGGPYAAPTDPQKIHTDFIVQMNSPQSPIGDPAVNPIKVVLQETAETEIVDRPPLEGASTELGHANAHWTKPGNDVRFYYSKIGDPEELNPYDTKYKDHHVKHYQAAFAGPDPIYEGGTVGVVINGILEQFLADYGLYLLIGLLVLLGGGGYALKKRFASRPRPAP